MNRQVWNYPGSSGKSAVAHDEWLELNNKEHANLPTVRLLEGMCRQGHCVGITERCKRLSMPSTLPAPYPSELSIGVVREQRVGDK